MKQLDEYRSMLIERLESVVDEFQAACLAVKDPFQPVDKDGWNTHQLATHTRDVDKVVYGMRVRRTLEDEHPVFQNFDADEWIAAHYNPDEPLASILGELTASIKETVSMLKTLPAEAWSRESSHETYGGGFTLQTWVERGLAHIQEHLETVQKAN